MSTCRPIREMTVEQESKNRGDCRYGLRGVTVKVPGYRGEFYVRSSAWEAGGGLALTLNVEPDREDSGRLRPRPLGEFIAEADAVRQLALVSMADVVPRAVDDLDGLGGDAEVDPPHGDVACPASRCYLRSFWPVVVGRPSRWNEFNSKPKARAAGLRIPGERRATRVGGRR